MSHERRTRVCLLVETYHPVIGGGETQARALAAGLGAFGIDMRVITRRSDVAFAAHEIIDGVSVRRLGPAGPGHLKKWIMLPGLFIELLRTARRDDVLLVCGYRVLGIAALPAGGLLRQCVVLKGDNSGEMSGNYFKAGASRLGLAGAPRLVAAFIALRNRLLHRADVFVSLSGDMRAELLANGVPEARIATIPNSVDAARFAGRSARGKMAARTALGLPENGLIVLFTGRLLESKGVLDLVHAWAALAADYPTARLVIVGSGQGLMHDCEAELHRLIIARGLDQSVVTTGLVRNVEDYLAAADIFAFPTTDEAFGISLAEAMAAGLAAVATRVGGIKDIVEPETNGLLIEPGDRAALEAALRRLLGDDALRIRLGTAATTTVEKRYTTEAVLRRYASLLDGLTTTPEGRQSLPTAASPSPAAASTSHVAVPEGLREIEGQGD